MALQLEYQTVPAFEEQKLVKKAKYSSLKPSYSNTYASANQSSKRNLSDDGDTQKRNGISWTVLRLSGRGKVNQILKKEINTN